MKIDWNAISAIGQILSSIITLGIGIVSFTPYLKKCDISFSFLDNAKNKPTLYIMNGSQRIRFIKKIQFRSGRFGAVFLTIYMFDEKDDLLMNGKKKYLYNLIIIENIFSILIV